METAKSNSEESKIEGPNFVLESFNFYGELEVLFTQNLAIPNNIDDINSDVINLQLIPDEFNISFEEDTVLRLDWSIKSFESKRMIIQVMFKDT